MPRFLSILLGPELLWVVFYLLCGWLKSFNVPPSPEGNLLLERSCTLGMFLATALSFVVFLVPGTGRWALLGRVVLAAVVGLNACLFQLIDGIDYGDSRNAGVLGFWFFGLMTGGLALLPGVIVAVRMLRRLAAQEP